MQRSAEEVVALTQTATSERAAVVALLEARQLHDWADATERAEAMRGELRLKIDALASSNGQGHNHRSEAHRSTFTHTETSMS